MFYYLINMNEKKIINIKTYNQNENVLQKENGNLLDKKIIYNSSLKFKLNQKNEKSDKPILLNDQNNIKSINIINNNYNNIIINNKLTPNKKLMIEDKTFSLNKRNYRILTLGKKQKNLQNGALKLLLNKKEENEIESKYKLIINEKNNLINNLQNEIEYFKNISKVNQNLSNNNAATSELKNNKNDEIENLKTKIKTLFSQHKNEIKLDNNSLLNKNINNYNAIKTINNIKSETNNTFIPNIFQVKPNNNNSYKINNKLIFNYSLKNDLKLNNKLTLDLSNNYNSIETNSNRVNKYKGKSPKFILTSNSINLFNKNKGSHIEISNYSNNYIGKNEDSTGRKPSFKKLKKNKCIFNNIISSPFSLKKETANKKFIDINFDSFNTKENISSGTSSFKFNYKDKFEDLKKRMSNLIENLFDIVEIKNNKNK